MAISFSHRFFVFLLKLTGGRKILGKQFAKGVSATAAPKAKDMARYSITKSEFKDLPIWTYAGDDTLIYYLHGGVEAIKPKRVVIMGDSAGGNLAIGLANWLRANKHKSLDKLILLAPWVDLEMAGLCSQASQSPARYRE